MPKETVNTSEVRIQLQELDKVLTDAFEEMAPKVNTGGLMDQPPAASQIAFWGSGDREFQTLFPYVFGEGCLREMVMSLNATDDRDTETLNRVYETIESDSLLAEILRRRVLAAQ